MNLLFVTNWYEPKFLYIADKIHVEKVAAEVSTE